jgi:hypothetical protein
VTRASYRFARLLVEGFIIRYLKQDDSVKENVIYARVSSAKQKADLVRQVDFLRHRFPNHKVVTDVGSGVNFKRKGLLSLLTPAAQALSEKSWSRQARQNWLRLVHVFLRQDQFSLSSKIMLATDVQKNSTKTSWRCLPISQPNTTESVPMPIEKWLVAQDQDPTERGAERASKQYAGTARYLHNQAKALAEGVSDRARATAIAGWEAEHDGTCKERSRRRRATR